MTKPLLLASVHDVTPVHKDRLERLVPEVVARVGAGRFALLAVPDFHGQGSIGSDPAFGTTLRGWADAGCEVFLHGHSHVDKAEHRGAAAFKARHMTASEGEFLGLDKAGALALLRDGKARVEDVIGRAVSGFIAPAWLYGEGALEAIAELGFDLAEDHFKVWTPGDRRVVARGPVITYATRTPWRLNSSIAFSRIARLALRTSRVVRLGVHPHDVDSPRIVREIGAALGDFMQSHRPGHYRELLRRADERLAA